MTSNFNDDINNKLKILSKLHDLECKGVELNKHYTIKSSYEEMSFEYEMQKKIYEDKIFVSPTILTSNKMSNIRLRMISDGVVVAEEEVTRLQASLFGPKWMADDIYNSNQESLAKEVTEIDLPFLYVETLHHLCAYLRHHNGVAPKATIKLLSLCSLSQCGFDQWDIDFISSIGRTKLPHVNDMLITMYAAPFGLHQLMLLCSAYLASILIGVPKSKWDEIVTAEKAPE